MNDLILYSYFRSSASYRVRIALGLKKLKYEYRAVHLLNNGGEQHDENYRKLNPSQEVPTLIHGKKAIGQSMAIIDYLDRVFTDSKELFPRDPFQRALNIQACEIMNSGSQPLHNLRVLQELGSQFGADQAQKDIWTKRWISYGLNSFQKLVEPNAKSFSFGSEPTAADCFLIPQMVNADRFGISLDAFPLLQRIRASCDQLEAFKSAHPKQQPDFPKDA